MKGSYEVVVRNSRVQFKLTVNRNLTILRGDSATGKTTLITMVADYEELGRESGVAGLSYSDGFDADGDYEIRMGYSLYALLSSDADESDNSLLKEFFDQLTCNIDDSTEKPRYWWIEEIENPQIARKLKMLSHMDLEIITLMVIDECKHEEIARIMGVSVRTIERKKAMFKKIFSEY